MKYKKSINKVLSILSGTIFSVILCIISLYGVFNLIFNEDDIYIFEENTEIQTTNIEEEEITANTLPETEEIMLVPLGDIFGIKLYTNGVIVSSLQQINSNGQFSCPAEDAGVMVGDYITAINGIEIESNEHFSSLMTDYISGEIILTIKRDDETFDTAITPVFDGTYYRFGMWIRDSAAGIGTLTYYNPADGTFGGLGHAIYDTDTGELMELKNGTPTSITISSIDKASTGVTGQIGGYFGNEISYGTLFANTESGLFGTLNYTPEYEAIPICEKADVYEGECYIISTIENGEQIYYSAEIIDINEDLTATTKNFTVKITDESLLSLTGGIIQGMSGSPIVQDGKLVGAVTHVFVSDPSLGYGIFIENMLETAETVY